MMEQKDFAVFPAPEVTHHPQKFVLMRNCEQGKKQTQCRSSRRFQKQLHARRRKAAAQKGHREPWPSASAPQPCFLLRRKMDMERAGNPQVAAGTKPTFLAKAVTNQYPSQEEAAGSNLVLR